MSDGNTPIDEDEAQGLRLSWVRTRGDLNGAEADCRTWVALDHTETPAVRFHHQLVAIHPFPNGNGRHARAAADYLCVALGLSISSWGANNSEGTIELRDAYLSALRAADRDPDDLEPLRHFMWS